MRTTTGWQPRPRKGAEWRPSPHPAVHLASLPSVPRTRGWWGGRQGDAQWQLTGPNPEEIRPPPGPRCCWERAPSGASWRSSPGSRSRRHRHRARRCWYPRRIPATPRLPPAPPCLHLAGSFVNPDGARDARARCHQPRQALRQPARPPRPAPPPRPRRRRPARRPRLPRRPAAEARRQPVSGLPATRATGAVVARSAGRSTSYGRSATVTIRRWPAVSGCPSSP